MEALIRPLEAGDKPAVSRLLDDTVGAGFWGFDPPGEGIAYVAVDPLAEKVAGVALCRLTRADDRGAAMAFGDGDEAVASPASRGMSRPRILHVRAVAVAPEARRRGLARGLLTAVEEQAADAGSAAAYLFAWLPAGQPEPAAVPFYLAAGYVPRPVIRDFYAAGSLASGAVCPFCGAPPCRCAARPYVKKLGAP